MSIESIHEELALISIKQPCAVVPDVSLPSHKIEIVDRSAPSQDSNEIAILRAEILRIKNHIGMKDDEATWGPPSPSVRCIVDAAAEVFAIPACELLSARRTRDVVEARQAIYLLARQLTPKSLPTIGRAINRDHTSVLVGSRKAAERYSSEPEIAEKIDRTKEIAMQAAAAKRGGQV